MTLIAPSFHPTFAGDYPNRRISHAFPAARHGYARAAQSLLGPAFRVSAQRGRVIELPDAADGGLKALEPEPIVVATVHPSAVLRDRSAAHDDAFKSFVDDLCSARNAYAG